jgi:putative transposase
MTTLMRNETMSQALSPSFARCYGLARVARVWKISRASVYRSLKETPPNTSARRPGPVGACSDAELADHIRQQIAASRLHGEGYRKLWARLRFAGVRASPRRVRRVMRENGLLAPHRVGRTEARPHDGTIITDKVNEMWGTDMTQTITIREGRANVFYLISRQDRSSAFDFRQIHSIAPQGHPVVHPMALPIAPIRSAAASGQSA